MLSSNHQYHYDHNIMIIIVTLLPTLTRSRSRTLLLTFSAKSEVLEIMECKCWASLITSCRLGLRNTEFWLYMYDQRYHSVLEEL